MKGFPEILFTRTVIALAMAVSLCTAVPAMAANGADSPGRTEVLDQLFERLATAEDEKSADLTVAAIWRIWLDSGSDTIDLLTRRAVEAIKEEELEAALQILDEVVELAPDYAEGWNKRATVHFMLQQYDASMFDVRQALALEPRHFGAISGLGTILKETDQPAAALKVYRKALEINPQLESARKAVKELAVEVEGREI